MDYSKLSDFEINKRVAEVHGYKVQPQFYNENKVTCAVIEDGAIRADSIRHADYCNNPSDAWPVIESIWDELMREECRGCGETVWLWAIDEFKCGKFRAAMIVFLMMSEK